MSSIITPAMAVTPNFQAVITRERARRGLGKTAFAKLIGVSRPSLDAYEEQGQVPKLEHAALIAQRLGLTLDQLAGVGPPPDRSLELAEAAAALRQYAIAQAGIANELQSLAGHLWPHGDQADASPAAGTG